MKIKFITIFLIGLLIGSLLGNILFGQVIAQIFPSPGTPMWYLKDIRDSVQSIEQDIKQILWK